MECKQWTPAWLRLDGLDFKRQKQEEFVSEGVGGILLVRRGPSTFNVLCKFEFLEWYVDVWGTFTIL